jgi:hypothetical protein
MAGDGGRAPDVSEQRAAEIMRTECAVCGKGGGYWGHRFDDDHPAHPYKPVPRRYVALSDPESVLAALLVERPDATIAALETLLTIDEAVDEAANAIWPLDGLSTDEARDELRRDTRNGMSAACRSLRPKAPKEDNDA